MKTKERGITLVALVVTIIVLLILAGISVMMITGQRGAVNQAAEAKDKTGRLNIIEAAQREVREKFIKKQDYITKQELYEILEKYFSNSPEVESWEYDDFPKNFTTELESKDGKYKVKIEEIYAGKLKENEMNKAYADIEAYIDYTNLPERGYYITGEKAEGYINIINIGDVDLTDVTVYMPVTGFSTVINIPLGKEMKLNWDYDITIFDANRGVIDFTVELSSNQLQEKEYKLEIKTGNASTITVRYWYGVVGGAVAAPTYSVTLGVGESYEIPSPVIEGYTPSRSNVKGVMSSANMVLDVIYTAIPHILTVEYVYEDGTTAAGTYTETLTIGDGYTIASPNIDGFTPDIPVVSGTMPGNDVTITVTYKPNP